MPLRTVLKHGRPPEHPVAITSDETKTWTDFTGDIDALVQEISRRDADRWILYSSDCYRFLTSLFALLTTESTAILPPKPKKGILKTCAETAGAAITDTSIEHIPEIDTGEHVRIDEHLGNDDAPGKIEFPYLDPERTCIELFTSGTTGDRSLIGKSITHLEQDLDAEDRIWGDLLDRPVFFGTVSQQHIYGLLIRLLWPFCSGHPFHPDVLLYPDDLKEAIESCAEKAVLVTSPSHLKSFVRAEIFDDLNDRLNMILSGGGTIPEDVSEAAYEQLGEYPLDVFGTTETGGIGWRRSSETAWNTFHNVETSLDDDGRLLVRSPAVSVSDDWFPTGDLAEAHDGSFVLGGREDRVVKIAGERVSLPEMEDQLNQHPDVEEAVAVPLPPDDPTTDRTTIGMVIRPSDSDSDTPDVDAEKLRSRLRDVLSDHFPSVGLPKAWSFQQQIPKDQLGKPQVDELRSNFDGS